MKRRPDLFISYKEETSILKNNTQRIFAFFITIFLLILGYMADDYWILLLTASIFLTIATWGLNIVSGMAGQISLAHGFFVAVGTYTAAVLGGISTEIPYKVIGYEVDMIIWLPLAGLMAAGTGLLIAPLAVRLKGLNLALVSIGIVYIGSYILSNLNLVTGGAGLGRKTAGYTLFGMNFGDGIEIGTFILTRNQVLYYLGLLVALVSGIGVKNLIRSKIGRAYAAIRDRDIAAEAIGINLSRFKASAFALSSFYAGIAGALMFSTIGGVDVERFGLLFSVTFIAIVVIGGVGTVMGPILGSVFFGLMPGIIKFGIDHSDFIREGIPLNPAQLERVIFGLFIVGFLIFEPRGLWGIWFRLRNYFKAWPFSY
jgi:branched-chain amino acid transport system permease protein